MPTPANDNFADALIITGEKGVAGPIPLDDATTETDEPAGSNLLYGLAQTVWFEWVAPRDGDFVFDTRGSTSPYPDYEDEFGSLDTTLAVWTGAALDELVEVASNDDMDQDGADLHYWSRVTVPAVEGTTYWIQLGTYAPFGSAVLRWNPADALPAPVLDRSEMAWRFIVTTLDLATLTFLDRRASDRTFTKVLNRAAVATGTVSADDPEISIEHTDGFPFLEEGVRCLVAFRREGRGSTNPPRPWICRGGLLLLQIEDTVENDVPVSKYTALDPWEILDHRPVVDEDGNLPGTNGLSFEATDPYDIATTLVQRTIDTHGPCFIWIDPTDAGGFPEIDINFPRGTMVGEALTQMCELGVIDVQLVPRYGPFTQPGILAQLVVTEQAGDTRDNAVFSWDRWPRSLVGITRLTDGTKRANKIQFDTAENRPAALQTDATSVSDYGEYWALQSWPGQKITAAIASLAAEQLLLRKRGQTTVTIHPATERAPVPLIDYDIGDRVHVEASKRLRKPLSGLQRVYGIPFTISDDSLETVEQLLVSADALA